jgi:hypothetical protein
MWQTYVGGRACMCYLRFGQEVRLQPKYFRFFIFISSTISLDLTVPLYFSTFSSKTTTFTLLTSYSAFPPHFVFHHHNSNITWCINNKEEQDSFISSLNLHTHNTAASYHNSDCNWPLSQFLVKRAYQIIQCQISEFSCIYFHTDNNKNSNFGFPTLFTIAY